MEFMRTGCSDRCRHIWASNWNKVSRTTAVACKEAQKWSWGYDGNICWPKLFIYLFILNRLTHKTAFWELDISKLQILFSHNNDHSSLYTLATNKTALLSASCPSLPVTHSTDIPVVALKCYQLGVAGKLLHLVAAFDLWMCLSMCGCLRPLTLQVPIPVKCILCFYERNRAELILIQFVFSFCSLFWKTP